MREGVNYRMEIRMGDTSFGEKAELEKSKWERKGEFIENLGV